MMNIKALRVIQWYLEGRPRGAAVAGRANGDVDGEAVAGPGTERVVARLGNGKQRLIER